MCRHFRSVEREEISHELHEWHELSRESPKSADWGTEDIDRQRKTTRYGRWYRHRPRPDIAFGDQFNFRVKRLNGKLGDAIPG